MIGKRIRGAFAALISSDHPGPTTQLMCRVPRGVGIVFKLSRDADLAAVESQFAVKRRTAVVSFTSAGPFGPSADVQMTAVRSDADGRGLTPRYQVEADNEASIALARSVGLRPFPTIVHYAHERRPEC